LTTLVENWNLVLILVLLIVGVIEYFFNRNRAKEWLLGAVTEAEKELGSKTGKLKLRMVYDAFITKFPIFSKLISFQSFSDMVDEVLVEMRRVINTNTAVFNYVTKDII
jgi:hypothetical protein